MNPTVSAIIGWLSAGDSVTLATLVRVEGSAPQPPGSMLAVGPDLDLVGTVGGGCVDSAVVELAASTDQSQPAAQVIAFSADDGPWAIGPVCGGRLTVLLERLDPDQLGDWQCIEQAIRQNRPVARLSWTAGVRFARQVMIIDPGPVTPDCSRRPRTTAQHEAARTMITALTDDAREPATARAGLVTTTSDQVAVQLWPRRHPMIIVGADAVAVELCRLMTRMGFSVTVCDPRPLFTRADRFPAADRVITCWPQDHLAAEAEAGHLGPDTAVCILTHDDRIEIPALIAALGVDRAGFVGALGSRATVEQRRARLLAAGADPQAVEVVRGPLGLDLGGSGPAALAISIAGEILAWKHGRTALPLTGLTGALHR